jgi:hypothetical protein
MPYDGFFAACSDAVIPAKAGIQKNRMDSGFRRNDKKNLETSY